MNRIRIAVLVGFMLIKGLGEISAEQPIRLKVMTFNILHGKTMNGDFDLDRIAGVIKDENPDLVALQEVDFKTRRARGYDLATELGLRTKMAPLFGRAMEYDGGEYGLGILSKYSFVSTRIVPLPHTKGREPRAALEANILHPSGMHLSFISTHLDHLSDGQARLKQAKAIVESFSDNTVPTILAGDLNALPDSETLKVLCKHWTPAYGDAPEPTYPSNAPRSKIDYILYAPDERWSIISLRVIVDEIASDHCALVAEIEFQP